MLQLENKYSRGAPPTLSGIGAHGGAIRPGSLRPSRNQNRCNEYAIGLWSEVNGRKGEVHA
jgi:hypothetical protein